MPDILVHNMSLKPKQTTSLLNKVSLDAFKTETSVPYKGVPYKINCVYCPRYRHESGSCELDLVLGITAPFVGLIDSWRVGCLVSGQPYQ